MPRGTKIGGRSACLTPPLTADMELALDRFACAMMRLPFPALYLSKFHPKGSYEPGDSGSKRESEDAAVSDAVGDFGSPCFESRPCLAFPQPRAALARGG